MFMDSYIPLIPKGRKKEKEERGKWRCKFIALLFNNSLPHIS
jgi:hypothetical protein